MLSRRRFLVFNAIVCSVLSASLTASAADKGKIERFKAAAENEGCNAIPFDGEKEQCVKLGEAKDSACQNFSCDRPTAERLLAKLEEKKQNLKDAQDRSNQSVIPELQRAVKDIQSQLNEMKYDASAHRIDQGEKCISVRRQVQELFAGVKSRVNDVSSDEDLKPYVGKLVDIYEQGAKRHEKPIEDTQKAVENCKWVASMNP